MRVHKYLSKLFLNLRSATSENLIISVFFTQASPVNSVTPTKGPTNIYRPFFNFLNNYRYQGPFYFSSKISGEYVVNKFNKSWTEEK